MSPIDNAQLPTLRLLTINPVLPQYSGLPSDSPIKSPAGSYKQTAHSKTSSHSTSHQQTAPQTNPENLSTNPIRTSPQFISNKSSLISTNQTQETVYMDARIDWKTDPQSLSQTTVTFSTSIPPLSVERTDWKPDPSKLDSATTDHTSAQVVMKDTLTSNPLSSLRLTTKYATADCILYNTGP